MRKRGETRRVFVRALQRPDDEWGENRVGTCRVIVWRWRLKTLRVTTALDDRWITLYIEHSDLVTNDTRNNAQFGTFFVSISVTDSREVKLAGNAIMAYLIIVWDVRTYVLAVRSFRYTPIVTVWHSFD